MIQDHVHLGASILKVLKLLLLLVGYLFCLWWEALEILLSCYIIYFHSVDPYRITNPYGFFCECTVLTGQKS